MKIVLVNQAHPSFGGPGGAERSVKTLAEGLAVMGHEVTSLAMAQNEDTGHLSENGIHSEHRIAGVRTVLFGKVKRSPTEAEMMIEVIDREAPDLVHTNTFWHNAELWRAVAERGIPIVHTLREYKLACPDNMHRGGANCARICDTCQLAAKMNQVRSEVVTTVVGISQFVLDRHVELGFFARSSDRVVIPNAVPTVADPPPAGTTPNGVLCLGYLGRLHPTKGIDVLIDAVLRRPDDAVRLFVAGPIQDRDIDRMLGLAEGDPRVEYLGFVEPGRLFERVEALVVPSRWPEPFGRIVVEAFAHGVPVLARRVGGLPESITVGETGWLFDDDQGLDRAIAELAADRLRFPAMRDACLRTAERYSPAKVAAEYEAVYRKAVSARRARSGRRAQGNGHARGRRTEPVLPRLWSRHARGNGGLPAPRVLVVTGEFPKLSETFVIGHITGLIDQGADVTIFCERPGGADQWHADVDRYRLLDRCLWYGMPQSLQAARDYICQNSRRLQQELARLLRDCSIMTMPPPLDELAREVVQEQVRTDLKLRLFHAAEVLVNARRQFDTVHCHFGHRGLFAAELKRMNVLDGQIVVSFHGIDMTEHVRRLGSNLYDSLKGECALYLPISNFFRERLLRIGVSPRRTVVHHVGVDCAKFRFQPRTLLSGEPVRLLSVGRLVTKKGIEYAVRALGVLTRKGLLDGLHYDIVGDGPERSALEKLVEELRLRDIVTFHGDASHDEVAAFMRRSHILIAPSVTAPDGDMEGIPTAIMEAMASGMPVVATNHSGIPELVKDKETGLLCEERDFEALAAAIHLLADNAELWPEFGRAGRNLVEHEFNIAVQNARLMTMYRDLALSTAASMAPPHPGDRPSRRPMLS